jgi:hypothetical protein
LPQCSTASPKTWTVQREIDRDWLLPRTDGGIDVIWLMIADGILCALALIGLFVVVAVERASTSAMMLNVRHTIAGRIHSS